MEVKNNNKEEDEAFILVFSQPKVCELENLQKYSFAVAENDRTIL